MRELQTASTAKQPKLTNKAKKTPQPGAKKAKATGKDIATLSTRELAALAYSMTYKRVHKKKAR